MKKKYLYIILILVFLFLCITILSSMSNTNVPDNFVTAKGKDLYIGSQKYRSVGVNRYNLLTHETRNGRLGCASPFTEEEIDTMFSQMQQLGITTVRFWLFQSATKSGEDLTRLDYVITVADKYGIKLIPVFENHWHNCTEGADKTPSWYASGYLSPSGGDPLSLKDYMGKIIPRYKNNPTILSWEIINEAREADERDLYAFAQDVSQYIKSLDSAHMVSLSMSTPKEAKSDYKTIRTIETIDILDYHDYHEDTDPLPASLLDHLKDSKAHNKPLLVGESGIKITESDRPNLFRAKMNAFFENGGDIYMIWSYGESYVTNDGYNFDISDPLAEVVKNTAREIKK